MDDSLQIGPGLQLIVGLLLLLLGRRLFWVFVGTIGFFVGMQFGAEFFADFPEWGRVLAAVGLGIFAALLTIVLQRLAVAIAGGFAGGLLAIRLAPMVGLYTDAGMTMAFIAGAAIFAVLLSVLFDPALIFISALVGAVMMGEALPVAPTAQGLAMVIFFVIGLVVQGRIGRAVDRVRPAD